MQHEPKCKCLLASAEADKHNTCSPLTMYTGVPVRLVRGLSPMICCAQPKSIALSHPVSKTRSPGLRLRMGCRNSSTQRMNNHSFPLSILLPGLRFVSRVLTRITVPREMTNEGSSVGDCPDTNESWQCPVSSTAEAAA